MRRFSIFAFVLATLLSIGHSAGAQGPNPSPVVPYLERVAWASEQRGPLLVVAPDAMVPALYGGHSPNLGALASEGGLNVLALAETLERKLARAGSVSALVPSHYHALNSALGKPDLSQLYPTDALMALVVSLDERQWKLLTGKNGLSKSELTPTQQSLFALLQPRGLQVGKFGAQSPPAVPESALAQGRVRLSRALRVSLAFEDSRLNGSGLFSQPTDSSPELSRDYQRQPLRRTYGVPLTDLLPNRLKPSALDYRSATLNRSVSLENLTTVGELLERVGAAVGRELRADKRIAALRLWQRSAPGQSARAGDVLELLALSVSGAFRHIEAPGKGRLWILTDDTEGLATRLERQRLWTEAANKQVEVLRAKNRERLRALSSSRPIPLDARLGLPESLEKTLSTSPRFTSRIVSLSDLAPELAMKLRGAAQEQNQLMQAGKSSITISDVKNPPLVTDRVSVTAGDNQLTWEIPGYGTYADQDTPRALSFELEFANYLRTAPPPPPAPARPVLGLRIASFSPQSADEARQVIAAAANAKLSGVWIATDATQKQQAVLHAALAEGKRAGVAVGALLSLAKLPESAPADQNLLGESGPYRIPDSPATLRGLRPLLQALVALPELAGLALTETHAPGYLSARLPRFGPALILGFGYTPARRLSFIRTEGYDPVDLAPNNSSGIIGFLPDLSSLPSSPSHPGERWNALRTEANKALLTEVYTALRAAAPSLPLWVRRRSIQTSDPDWFGTWDRPDSLPTFLSQEPPTDGSPYDPFNPLPQARRASKQVLFAYVPDPTTPPEENQADILSWVLDSVRRGNKTFPWDGAVLDLSALSTEKALAALQEIRL